MLTFLQILDHDQYNTGTIVMVQRYLKKYKPGAKFEEWEVGGCVGLDGLHFLGVDLGCSRKE